MDRDATIRFIALVRKETLQVIRDPSSILIAFVLPVVLLFLFGYALSLDATVTRIGIAIESPTPAARELAANFQASRYFTVKLATDRRELEEDLVVNRIRGIVVIPADFTADNANPQTPPRLQVLVDGTDPNTASFVLNYAQGVVQTWRNQTAIDHGVNPAPLIDVEQRVWFNQELVSRNFLVPGAIAIVMTMIGTLLTALVVAREWERGTMEAMMATPVSSLQLLAGKILPYFILGLLALTLCVAVSVLLFGVPFRGSLIALYLVSAAFLCPALGLGLLISAGTKNQFLASQLALVAGFLPAFLLSGFLFEIASMPKIIQWLTMIIPARYYIPALQTVFLAGDIWPLYAQSIAVLLTMGAVLFALAARTTKKRLA
ncbi:inner membrane transport permease YbhS [Variibacter gotjawalensis]|uniref:Inner membrane transport permease YbhS n=1 Tax=Variibacter gotjawalensis TaxID=1333996 RepID=A0A0S3PUI8_9BRAD|nr:ABC transporter permease [Variibacter gotjawalensis]NIK49918.1 ABC-2 type transport system permease protein [Variibacter gotjawalensis]RZS45917.1 ABC-2 type transport system permease protein [Variibacter gotjawalensis]BAT59592.1 inner membrane transport permease YbhS [Variibacter gotjawalensis]